MKQLVQRLQSAVTEHWIIWDSIILVVTFDSLNNDFEITTAPLLYSGNKDLEKIQQIVISTKAANMAKKATGQIANLLMMAKKKMVDSRQQPKSRSTKEYFNYGKRGYYAKDCCSASKRKPNNEKGTEEAKRTQ